MRYQTGDARTASKEPMMKFYEIPESAIAESLRQISFKVAKRYLSGVRPPYLCTRKQACGVCRGNKGVIPLYQESGRDKTGCKTGYEARKSIAIKVIGL